MSETTGFSGKNITAETGQCFRRILEGNLKEKVGEGKIGVERNGKWGCEWREKSWGGEGKERAKGPK